MEPSSRVRSNLRKIDLRDYVIYISFVVIFVLFSIILHDKAFLTGANLMNIARQTAMVSVMAIGMTFVLCAGEIDLSIGSTVALASLLAAIAMRDYNIFVAIAAGLGCGAVIGLVNGLLTTKANIPSFLVTLGMMSIISGFARWITNLEAVPVTNDTFNFLFGSGDLGPVSVLFIWTGVLMVMGHIVLRRTAFGRQVLATGGNRTAARYSGVRVDRIKIAVLVVSGTMAALAGMLYAGRLHGARYTLGETDLMTVIAAVIIGGTALSGGKGSVVGAVIGSLIMGMINNGLILMGLTVTQQIILRGVIIILAVALSTRPTESK